MSTMGITLVSARFGVTGVATTFSEFLLSCPPCELGPKLNDTFDCEPRDLGLGVVTMFKCRVTRSLSCTSLDNL
jgi:hypothetical protein